MGDFRIRYGMALGRQNNFYAGISGQKGYLAGTDGLFAQGNTAPDITVGNLFYTNNSSATIINSFTLQHPSQGSGNVAGLYEGKLINIVFLDSNTTLSGSRFFLSSTNNTFGANSVIELIYHNSGFYEMGRSNVYSDMVSLQIANSSSVNANFVTSYLLSYVSTGGVSGLATVQSISNGMVGQRLLLINNQSTGTIAISTAGNIAYSTVIPTVAGSGIYSLSASGGVVELIKVSNNQWSIVGR